MRDLDVPTIRNEDDLEMALSEAYDEDVEAASELGGGLIVLGAGGKMGPSLVRRAVAAMRLAGLDDPVIAVSRFGDVRQRERLEQLGVRTLAVDLLDDKALQSLPVLPNVIMMTGMKFGTSGNEPATWAMNSYLPGRVVEHFSSSRIVAFSTGNVYPLVSPATGGCTEQDPLGPVGEYAQSCLGRERLLSYFADRNRTPVCILRLNYAVEARYGVLLDIGRKVQREEEIPLEMGHVNVIWQGDANSVCFRAFRLCAVPPDILNLTGPEILSVRQIAQAFGRHFGVEPRLTGREGDTALLNNASRCHSIFGTPQIGVDQVIELVAHWIRLGGSTLGKPTKFEITDGRF